MRIRFYCTGWVPKRKEPCKQEVLKRMVADLVFPEDPMLRALTAQAMARNRPVEHAVSSEAEAAGEGSESARRYRIRDGFKIPACGPSLRNPNDLVRLSDIAADVRRVANGVETLVAQDRYVRDVIKTPTATEVAVGRAQWESDRLCLEESVCRWTVYNFPLQAHPGCKDGRVVFGDLALQARYCPYCSGRAIRSPGHIGAPEART